MCCVFNVVYYAFHKLAEMQSSSDGVSAN